MTPPPPTRRLAWATTLLVTLALSGCDAAGDAGEAEADDGPLDVSTGFKAYAAPHPGSLFTTFTGCVHGGAADVEIKSVRPLEASPGVTLRVAWPTEQRPNTWGSGPLRRMPDFFDEMPSTGTSGTVQACGTGAQTLTFAAVFPPAEDELAYMDGVRVDYAIEDETFETVSDVELGVCPQDPTVEPEPCSGD